MKARDIAVYLVGIILAICLLWAAGAQLDSINEKRKAMKLVMNEPLENAPPSLAFATVAMGAFRGLVVDILWIRADALKEQGQFFDARQLAEWITTLQPRFPDVWVFQAWNMAYNISVAIPVSRPDQRWHWVKSGYELLRDKGIPLNPKSLALYQELGRIFQHKIGGITDDAHKYYKVQLAKEIGPLVEVADQSYFEALAAAPTDWSQIYSDPNLRPIIHALMASDDAFSTPERFFSSYMALTQDPNRFGPRPFQVIQSYLGDPNLRRLGLIVRAHQLRRVWKMDPAFMVELNKLYGPVDFNDPNHVIPLDWRHPDSHAIYWAAMGLKMVAEEQGRKLETVELNTDRIIMHSLQNLFRYGRLLFYDVAVRPQKEDGSLAEEPVIVTDVFVRPDLRMFDRYHQAVLALMEKYSDKDTREESLAVGHRNMLRNAVLSFYQSGLVAQAQRIYDELRRRYPLDEFKVPLAEFCRRKFIDELQGLGMPDATEQVVALLKQSYYLYAIGSDDEAFGTERLVQQIYDYYHKEYSDEQGRLGLPTMARIRYTALIDLLGDPQYPPYLRQNLLTRIRNERPQLFELLQKEEQQLQATRPVGP
ncbi:MAG: hypothetical protein QHH07_02125 [Sedimentisphaerales bacterium]|nr:hypothetical protein [Sedimentisphaerales bacterium]